jgi:hypothetical protein
MKLSGVQMSSDVIAQTYLMMSRMESGNLEATSADFKTQSPENSDSPAFDGEQTFGYTFKEIGPQVDGDKIRVLRKK